MRMSPTTRRLGAWLFAGALALTAAGCGGDAEEEAGGEMEMEDDEHTDEEDDHDDGFAFGEPADAADADRTIEVEARDELVYEPAEVEVAAGETITFVVTNTGEAVHEFTIGDRAAQEDHAAEMGDMEGEMAHEDPNMLTIEPGETAEITWHFSEAGEVLYACHEPGHYEGGMVGTITVTDS